jgi:hypothetical protein
VREAIAIESGETGGHVEREHLQAHEAVGRVAEHPHLSSGQMGPRHRTSSASTENAVAALCSVDGWADASLHVRSALRRSSLRIECAAARRLIAEGALLVDVRRGEDGLDSPDGALRVTPDLIPECLGAFSRGVPIVLGCT